MHPQLYVRLDSSDNEYLDYPCFGMLELFELGTDGSVISGVLRLIVDGKRKGGPVSVKNPCFSCGEVAWQDYAFNGASTPQGEPSELSDAEVRDLATKAGFHFHTIPEHAPTQHTNPLEYSEHCFHRFARALLSRRTVPDAAPAEREKFERWASGLKGYNLKRNPDGSYFHTLPDVTWEAWQVAILHAPAFAATAPDQDKRDVALKQALSVLGDAKGNINPERSFADEVESDIDAAIVSINAAMQSGEKP
jgi:hypothetical protein